MLCHSDNRHPYSSEKFASHENSYLLNELVHDKRSIFKNENSDFDECVRSRGANKTISSHFVGENLFAGLIDPSVGSSINVLDEPTNKCEIDFNSILQNINLDSVDETASGSGSDKENVSNNFSLADLYFKEKDGFVNSQNSQAICIKQELDFEISPQGSENSTSESGLECILNLSTNNDFQCGNLVAFSEKPDNTLPCLFNDLLVIEKHKLQSQEQSEVFDKEDCEELKVDLTSLKKCNRDSGKPLNTTILQKQTNHLDVTELCSKETIEQEYLKTKSSSFCKVLCAKVKPTNLESIPKLPQTLPELLIEMDHYRYFTFDTPSPDDIVKEKQKYAFLKH